MLEVLGFAGCYRPPNSQFDPAAAVLGGVPISALWCTSEAANLILINNWVVDEASVLPVTVYWG